MGPFNFNSVFDKCTLYLLNVISRFPYRIIFGVGVLIFILFVAVDIGPKPRQLTSLGGMATFVIITFITSTNPSKVRALYLIIRQLIRFAAVDIGPKPRQLTSLGGMAILLKSNFENCKFP